MSNKTKKQNTKTIETDSVSPSNGASEAKMTTIDLIEEWLNCYYNFRYNIVTGRIEYRPKESISGYELLDERKTNSLLRSLKKKGITTNISDLRSILISDFSVKYDPFAAYFSSLPVWDGITDYIGQLASTVKTTNDVLWQSCFKKWIVAMVACLLDESIINHTVIVFSGRQGIGKTTWMLNLVPQQLGDYCFSGTINPNNKDTLLHLSECMLINLDELENLNKTEVGSLKELITKNSIRVRRAYGYYNENLSRRASFAGSVNSKEFLNDTTGTRRFLCFEVTGIDYDHSIDIRNVYAQALYLFKSDSFRYWFDQEEILEIIASNEQYHLMSMEEESLLKWYEPVAESEATFFQSPTDIATNLSAKTGLSVNNSVTQRLGKALKKHNFIRLKRRNRYVYAMKEKDAEILEYQSKYRMEGDQAA